MSAAASPHAVVSWEGGGGIPSCPKRKDPPDPSTSREWSAPFRLSFATRMARATSTSTRPNMKLLPVAIQIELEGKIPMKQKAASDKGAAFCLT